MSLIIEAKRGPKPDHNYAELWYEYRKECIPGEITYEEFAKRRSINPNTIRTHFCKLKRAEQLALVGEQNPDLILLAQERIKRALKSGEGVKEDAIAAFSLDAYKAVSDREGLSPQAQIINVTAQANAQSASVMAPIFGEPSEEMKKLMGAE